MTLLIKKNHEDAIVPTKPNPTDSGFDLYAYQFLTAYRKSVTNSLGHSEFKEKKVISSNFTELNLFPGERVLIDTGISATIGEGYELQIRPRSGLCLKKGLTVLNSPGTIDCLYTGMIGVIIINQSNEVQTIGLGDRIAQLVPMKVELPEIEVVEDLDATTRGEGGFGSTGK